MTNGSSAGTTGRLDSQGYFMLNTGRRFMLPDRFGRTLATPKESIMIGGSKSCNAVCDACGAFGHRGWECELPRALFAQGKLSETGGPP